MKLNYEIGKEKSEVKFKDIANISYMSDGNERTSNNHPNGPRFEHSLERQPLIDDEERTCTTNKLESRTNLDEREQMMNNLNNSLVQNDNFDNESAQTLPVNKNDNKSRERNIETVQAEHEIAKKRYVAELARIAKIADKKRIQKLEQMEIERQQSEARLKQKEDLKKEIERKKKEAEEAEAAMKQIEDMEAEQERQKELERKQIFDQALRMAREEQIKREEEIRKREA